MQERAGQKNRINIMKHSTKNNIKGKLEESKGKAKEVAGKLVDDPKLENKGKVEKIGGQAQNSE